MLSKSEDPESDSPAPQRHADNNRDSSSHNGPDVERASPGESEEQQCHRLPEEKEEITFLLVCCALASLGVAACAVWAGQRLGGVSMLSMGPLLAINASNAGSACLALAWILRVRQKSARQMEAAMLALLAATAVIVIGLVGTLVANGAEAPSDRSVIGLGVCSAVLASWFVLLTCVYAWHSDRDRDAVAENLRCLRVYSVAQTACFAISALSAIENGRSRRHHGAAACIIVVCVVVLAYCAVAAVRHSRLPAATAPRGSKLPTSRTRPRSQRCWTEESSADAESESESEADSSALDSVTLYHDSDTNLYVLQHV